MSSAEKKFFHSLSFTKKVSRSFLSKTIQEYERERAICQVRKKNCHETVKNQAIRVATELGIRILRISRIRSGYCQIDSMRRSPPGFTVRCSGQIRSEILSIRPDRAKRRFSPECLMPRNSFSPLGVKRYRVHRPSRRDDSGQELVSGSYCASPGDRATTTPVTSPATAPPSPVPCSAPSPPDPLPSPSRCTAAGSAAPCRACS